MARKSKEASAVVPAPGGSEVVPAPGGSRQTQATTDQTTQTDDELRYYSKWLRFVNHAFGVMKVKRMFAYSGHLLKYFKRRGLEED